MYRVSIQHKCFSIYGYQYTHIQSYIRISMRACSRLKKFLQVFALTLFLSLSLSMAFYINIYKLHVNLCTHICESRHVHARTQLSIEVLTASNYESEEEEEAILSDFFFSIDVCSVQISVFIWKEEREMRWNHRDFACCMYTRSLATTHVEKGELPVDRKILRSHRSIERK